MKVKSIKKIIPLLLSAAMLHSSIGAISVFADDNTIGNAPTVELKAVNEDHAQYYEDTSYFCEAPTITFTAANNKTIDKITITINSNEEPEPEGTVGTITPKELKTKTVTVTPPENLNSYSRLYTIEATDSEELKAYAKVYVGHSLGARTRYTLPETCTSPEIETGDVICGRCEAVFDHLRHVSDTTPSGHDWETETISGCKGSYTLKTCKKCSEKVFEDDTTGTGEHNWSDYKEEKVTCTTDSRKYRTCQNCGFVEEDSSYTKTVARGHRYSYYSYGSTCTEWGKVWYQCDVCKHEQEGKTKNYDPIGHNYVHVTEPATCDAPGRTYKQCTRKSCQDVIDIEEIPQLSHNWIEGDIVETAPCGGTGTREYNCSLCGAKEVRDYTKEHVPVAVNGDCTVSSKCADCDATLDQSSANHNFTGDYKVVQNGHRRACVNPGCEQLGEIESHSAIDDGNCMTPLICDCGVQIESGYDFHSSAVTGGWYNDETHHWRVCTREGCEQKIQSASHVWKDDGNCETAVKCSVCDFEITSAKIHTLESSYDSYNHFEMCTNANCTYTTKIQEHSMGYTSDSSGHWLECDICDYRDITSRSSHTHEESDHDCTTPVKCDACGWNIIDAFAEHQLNSTLSHDTDYHWYGCSNPDCQFQSDKEEHTPGEELKRNEILATCTTDGSYELYTVCTTCGTELSSRLITLKASHSYNEEITPPTCTGEGYTTYTCAVCGYSYTGNTVSAIDHVWGEWETISSPDCDDDGAEKRVCSVCGSIEQKGVTAKGHEWEKEYEVDKVATCVDEGSESIHCQICDAVKPDSSTTIPALGHSYTNFTTNDNATCTSDATKTAKCDRCDETYTETIPETIKPHEWGEWKTLSNPTCTETGSNIRYCEVCNNTEIEEIPALGHNFGDWSKLAEEKCVLPGTEARYCDLCGEIDERTIEPPGHNYVEGICMRCGSIKYTASVGRNGLWINGDDSSDTGLVISLDTIRGDLSKLVELRVNGDVLDTADYTIDGNLIILTSKYLATLDAGNYDLILVYPDGGTTAAFEVRESDPKPDDPTEDNSSNTPSNSSQPTTYNTTTITTTTSPAKTTRNANDVKKDKAVAKKAMKQAKITKLTSKSNAKKKITVSWKKVKKAKGYQIQVSAKKNFKKIIFKKFISKNKLTIKNNKIKSKKTYYIRVRAYATYKDKNGTAKKVYSKWIKKPRKITVK